MTSAAAFGILTKTAEFSVRLCILTQGFLREEPPDFVGQLSSGTVSTPLVCQYLHMKQKSTKVTTQGVFFLKMHL